MLQLIKEALGQNGVTPRDDSPVTEVLNQVCPSSWRGACKTAVQLLFAQAGLVSIDVRSEHHSVVFVRISKSMEKKNKVTFIIINIPLDFSPFF